MSKRTTAWGAWVVLAGVLAVLGCSPDRPPQPAAGPPAPPLEPAAEPATEPEPKQPIPIEVPKELAPQPTAIPEVKLSEALSATCKIGVGDPLPEATLPAADGKNVSIRDVRGEAATVVLFWTAGETDTSKKIAASILADIQADAVSAYGARKVNAVAINQRDSAETAAEIFAQAKVGFPMLMDPGGNYFAQVATERLPRIYVLDHDGKIAWFDVDYSETTRRILKDVLRVIAGEPQPAAQPRGQ
jgi:peroxiredoxin